jgi:hypothetical protein
MLKLFVKKPNRIENFLIIVWINIWKSFLFFSCCDLLVDIRKWKWRGVYHARSLMCYLWIVKTNILNNTLISLATRHFIWNFDIKTIKTLNVWYKNSHMNAIISALSLSMFKPLFWKIFKIISDKQSKN